MCGSEESRKEARRLTALVYWDRGTVWIIGGASGWVSAAWTWGWLSSCQPLFDRVCVLGLGRSWTNEREGIYFVWEAMACGRVGGRGVE